MDLSESGQTILAAWIAKEELRALLALAGTHPDRTVIAHRLTRFYTWRASAAVPELQRLATTVSTWWPCIEALLHTGITNAGSEGHNRIVKLDARNAYGYRNPENQRLRTRCATTRRARGCLNPGYLRRPCITRLHHKSTACPLSGLDGTSSLTDVGPPGSGGQAREVTMRFIYDYPETNGFEGDMLDAGPIHEVAVAAERAGFDGFALTEHPVPSARWLASGGHQSLDPFVALGFAAAATERLKLITHLVVAPYRNPFLLAKAAATLDKLSGGRFVLGLGTGYQKAEFYALGVDIDERNALFDEALDVLPLHWGGEPFSYHGRHFDAQNVVARPRPVQNPIPIWIGGNSRLSRRRVAQRAQGWMPMIGPAQLAVTTRTVAISSLAELAPMVRELRDAADAAGRSDPLDVLFSYQDGSLATPTVEPDRHREAWAEAEKAGITWISVTSDTHTPTATLEFLEAFGSTYL